MGLDIGSYSGLWYEVARTENWFEKDCDYATANYTLLDNGNVQIVNKCYSNGKESSQIIGNAKPGLRKNSLKVSFEGVPKFLSLFANYFIVYTDYTNFSVSTGPLGLAWILSRKPQISKEDMLFLLSKLPESIRENIVETTLNSF